MVIESTEVRVADECWIGLALLHREHPERGSFSAREILDRLRSEKANPELRPGVQPHVYLHNVANIAPNSGKYRMFYRLDDGTLRLFRPGDDFDPARTGKSKPERSDLPPKYQNLLDWYESEYCIDRRPPSDEDDPVLRMWGVGEEIWKDEGGDAFIERERKSWDEPLLAASKPSEESRVDRVWQRILNNQGQMFHTATGKPFTYTAERSGAIWFQQNGRRINRRLARSDTRKAILRCPLSKTSDIKDCSASAYLFGLLMDGRIRANEW